MRRERNQLNIFCRLENRIFTNNIISSLINNDGEELNDTTLIIKEQESFYRNLNQKNSSVDTDPSLMLNNIPIPKLENDMQQAFEQPLSLNEIGKATLAMNNNKSPGLEGFQIDFFNFFWKEFGYGDTLITLIILTL